MSHIPLDPPLGLQINGSALKRVGCHAQQLAVVRRRCLSHWCVRAIHLRCLLYGQQQHGARIRVCSGLADSNPVVLCRSVAGRASSADKSFTRDLAFQACGPEGSLPHALCNHRQSVCVCVCVCVCVICDRALFMRSILVDTRRAVSVPVFGDKFHAAR